MTDAIKPDTEVLTHIHEAWVLPVREPIGISDETVAAIVQGAGNSRT